MNNYPWLDEYLQSMPGVEKDFKVEWEWFRYMLRGKLFAAVCTPDENHALHKGRTLVNLKCDPALAELYRAQYPDVVPGFYCNKEHWNSVYLDGSVPEETVKAMCDMAYNLVFHKLPKKVQREIVPE
ncbi:MAG: MmcQ/YjbR family DNA-binding protein [Eubacteriales bacterium]|nr:MmcQ/YjbR family DNA-binding protein [Eubacteriales bacterium]